MCGISGAYSLDSSASSTDLSSFTNSIISNLTHRGPDSFQSISHRNFALSHARLSIRDLSSRSNQPISSRKTHSILAYNGEIYNTSELSQLLARKQHNSADSTSDTLVLLDVLDCYGLNGLKLINGTFSFAWFNPHDNSLYLVRDRLGVKPLFYLQLGNLLLFSSEHQSLHQFSSRIIDSTSYSEYLWFGNRISPSHSFFTDIKSLPPATYLRIQGRNLTFTSWWSPDEWKDSLPPPSFSQIEHTFSSSIKSQLVSDVPSCLLLSGGIDSSFLAAHLHSSATPAVYADFSTPYSDNESARAEYVANTFNLPYKKIPVSPNPQLVSTIQRSFGEPFADPATIPLSIIYQSLSSDYRVCLQGDGGDELFSGYSRHKFLRYYPIFQSLSKPFSLLPRKLFPPRLSRLMSMYSQRLSPSLFAQLMTVHSFSSSPHSLLTQDFQSELNIADDLTREFQKVVLKYSKEHPLTIGFLCDILIQLPSQFFPKVDITSMRHSVEARVPLADDQLLRLALNLSPSQRVHQLRGKATIRNSFPNVSTEFRRRVVRQTKKGFNSPFISWMEGTLREDLFSRLTDRHFLDRFHLDPHSVESLLLTLRQNGSALSPSNAFSLFQLYCLSFHL